MSTSSILFDKSNEFALRIVNLRKYIVRERREYVLSMQMLRSGTSIGANLAEAIYGLSDKDFHAKLQIALKECAETKYWIGLLYRSDYISEREFQSIDKDCTELLRMLIASAKTLAKRLRKG